VLNKLSFIVPCHNVERYVKNCLDSIISCNLLKEDYEIICLNDGSTDRTFDVLSEYSGIDNIRIINLLENVGYGGVRNIGIREAIGDYIWFVDSDDAIISKNVSPLLELAEKNKLDVLAFNFDRLNEFGVIQSICRVFHNTQCMSGVEFVKNELGDMLYCNIGYMWRFLFRKDYLIENNLYIPEGMCWEDTVFVPQTMIKALKIQSSELSGYQYYFHQSSVCRMMDRQYPGNLIYDYVFRAGVDLLHYANGLKDAELRFGLSNFARKTYLHSNCVLYLLRTSTKERKLFYHLIKKNRHVVNSVRPEIKGLAYVMIYPKYAFLVAEVMSILYKYTKKWKSIK